MRTPTVRATPCPFSSLDISILIFSSVGVSLREDPALLRAKVSELLDRTCVGRPEYLPLVTLRHFCMNVDNLALTDSDEEAAKVFATMEILSRQFQQPSAYVSQGFWSRIRMCLSACEANLAALRGEQSLALLTANALRSEIANSVALRDHWSVYSAFCHVIVEG